MKMPPDEYLTPRHIPGTPEWEDAYKISKKIFDKVMKEAGYEHKK